MKTKVFLIGLLFSLAFQANAQKAPDIFDKLAEEKDVVMVRITKVMFEAMPDVAERASFNGLEFGDLREKLDLLEVFTTEKPEIKKQMKEGMELYRKSSPLIEEIMFVREEDTEVRFLVQRKELKSESLSSFAMFVIEADDESVILRLTGDFTMQDVKKILSQINL